MERLVYRGRPITDQDIHIIRRLIADYPGASRRRLSCLLCEAWDWRQANGAWRDMVCRSLMLVLHRAGWIELPPVRQINPNPLAHRRRPSPVEVDRTPLEAPLSALQPLDFVQVRRSGDESLLDSLLEQHHYLGYTQPVGEHLKYLVYAQGRPLAGLSWSSAVRHLGCRDRFIGWSPPARRRNLHLLAYNCRYLVLPWIRVPHLASHILGRMARIVPQDWQRIYGHPVYYLETFVDPNRFAGTCYRAANWIVLGSTTGRGKDDQTHRPNRPLKQVLGLPLVADFRQRLGGPAAVPPVRAPHQARLFQPGESCPGGGA